MEPSSAQNNLLPAVDWMDQWKGKSRRLTGAFQSDPQDPRTTMRGSGSIALGGGLAIMNGSPRLYISSPDSQTAGFENLEFTVWGKFENFGTLKSYSGLTIAVRSNHENYYDNGCDAAGYYFRIRAAGAENGFITFQKEYYHSTTAGTVYSSSTYQETATFPGGIPLQQWIGIKFRATTIRSADGTYDEKVHLEAYIDLTDGFQGGDWQLAFEYYDVLNGGTMSATKTVPPECPIQSGIPIFGARSTVYLRSDGDMNTEVHWKDASVTEISSQQARLDGGTIFTNSIIDTFMSVASQMFYFFISLFGVFKV